MKMAKTTFKITIWKEGKHYVAQCLNVDVSSFGESRREALKNLHEALDLYFEDEKKPAIVKVERPKIETLSLNHA